MNFVFVPVVICLFLAGCDDHKEENNASQPAAIQQINGDFRLVKLADNDGVWIIKDGKRSMVAEWGWVERNGKGKKIEIIKADELESYPNTGIGYK